MKVDEIKNNVKFIEQEIILNIFNIDLLNDRERDKFFRNIENTLDQFNVDLEYLLGAEIALIYKNELKKAMKTTGTKGLEKQLNSMVHQRALNDLLTDSFQDLKSAIRTAKQTTNNSIHNAIDLVKHDIAEGVLYGHNINTIRARVAQSFSDNGMKAFYTVDGKVLPLDFYAEVVTNTKLSSARTTAHATHYERHDVDLFTVHGREDTCEECAAHRNIVFSMSGKDDRFPHLDPKTQIPFHPNCRCIIRPYVIEYKTDEEMKEMRENGRNYDPYKDPRTKKQREAYEKDQRAKRKAREELKQYQHMLSTLGKEAPKTLGAFRRMKRADTDNYKKLINKTRNQTKKTKTT